MITVRLVGGLGNQLFQYATGRALAARLGVPIGIDARFYAKSRNRHLELGDYTLPLASPGALPAEGFLAGLRDAVAGRRVRRFREKSLAFDPTVLALPDGSYLDGYFQNEAYFAHCAGLIRAELVPTTPPPPFLTALRDEIAAANAVSLHIRRGDYVSNPRIAAVHGVLSLDYYRRAATVIAPGLDSPLFFVFSDEPAWAEEHLRLPYPMRFVSSQGPASQHLALMAACRHHIIANSSFSWWGAWLNPSSSKRVVAPRNWFADGRLDAGGIVPPGWTRL